MERVICIKILQNMIQSINDVHQYRISFFYLDVDAKRTPMKNRGFKAKDIFSFLIKSPLKVN